ncbi:MAG TPA: hypothetical protein VFS42_00665 [Burkholderiaceae bacterium]|nr:hypothetical protein [Burkholderiaceae bacterium]
MPGDLIRRISEGVSNSHASAGGSERQDFFNLASVSVHWRRALQLKVKSIRVTRPQDLANAVKAYPNATMVHIAFDSNTQAPVNLSALKHLPNLDVLIVSPSRRLTTAQLQTLELHPQAKGVTVSLNDSKSCNSMVMAHLASVGAIKGLMFVSSPTENLDIEAITPLKDKLVTLAFRSLSINGQGFKHLQGFSKLEVLIINNCNDVDNAHLGLLSDLPSLKALDLSNSLPVSDTGFHHLCQLRSLETLKLDRLEVGAIDSDAVRGLNRLKHLTVREHITNCDEALHAIGGLSNLESLCLGRDKDRGNVSPEGIAQLKSLKKLQTFVCLSNTFNDAALMKLEGLTNLREVRISNGTVSDKAIASFKEANKEARLVLR